MSLPDWHAFFSARAEVLALVGARIYPLLIPQHIPAHGSHDPSLVFQLTSAPREANYCATERIVVASYQFGCCARRYEVAMGLADAVRRALRDFVGLAGECRIRLMRLDTDLEQMTPEPGLFIFSSNYSVWYVQAAP